MKVAVCYSGMFRNFTEVIDNHIKHLISKYDCDVFMSFWDVYGIGGFTSEYTTDKRTTWDFKSENEIISKVHPDKISQKDIDYVLNKLNPKEYEFEDFSSFQPHFKSWETLMNMVYKEDHTWLPRLMNVMSMYYKIHRSGYLAEDYSTKYDCVIRLRSDMEFPESQEVKLIEPGENTICINSWGKFHESYMDTLVYGDQKGMSVYHDMFFSLSRIWKEVGRKSGNENLLYHYLNKSDVNLNFDTDIQIHKMVAGSTGSRAGHFLPKDEDIL